MSYISLFFQALSLTVLIECIVACALQYFGGRRFSFCPKYSRLAFTVALASIFTLPYIWFILPELIKSRLAYELVSEIGVTIAESLWYVIALQIKPQKALILSICANLFSVLIGKLFF